MNQQSKNIFYILLAFAMLGWGASWVNVKILSFYINEYEMMFLRFFFTALTMIPIMIVLRKSFKIDWKTFGLCLLTSIVFILYLKYFFVGTKLGTAGLGGALVTTMIPINTFLIMALFFSRKVQIKDILALLLGAVGVFTMLDIFSFEFDSIFTLYNLYFLLASILWPVVTILSSKSRNISPIVFTFYLYIITSVLVSMFFTDIRDINYTQFDFRFYVNIFSIIIFASTFANTIYFLGIEKLGTNEVSSFIFLVPFSALFLSSVFLDEQITISTIIGTIMTLVAVKILNNIKFIKAK